MKYQEYTAPSGELIQKYKEGEIYIVSSSSEEEGVRWSLKFKNENEANVEFERWRK